MSDLIRLDIQGSVAVFTMSSDENRHNPDFIAGFHQLLDSVEKNTGIGAIVLTSSSAKNWSLGIDLAWMSQPSNTADDNAEFMLAVTALLKRIIIFPVPVIASMNGHAFGNGAILACACDFRFMRSDKGFFCFPEVDVLVPFFPSMFPLIQKAIPQQFFNRLAMSGQRVNAQDLMDNNVVEGIFDDEEKLQQGVLEFASQFNKNRWIYGQNKTQMNKDILSVMSKEDPDFIAQTSKVLTKMMQK